MKDPWTCTAGWGLTMKVGGGLGGKEKGGNQWNQCEALKIKIIKRKEKST